MNSKRLVALGLADTFLAGEAEIEQMRRGAVAALGENWPFVASLCRFVHKRTGEHFHYFSREEFTEIILSHRGFSNAWLRRGAHPQIRRYCLELPRKVGLPEWVDALGLPPLETPGDLAQWLNLPVTELDWFADRWRNNSPAPEALRHYRYRWVAKKSGGMRLIEMPKMRLRAMQRQVLHQLLDKVPPHAAAHGFRRAHSCVTHASAHVGKRVVLRMDLADFFPSIPAPRIHALFARLGYSHRVAAVLARLCTHRTPSGVFNDAAIRQVLTPQDRMRFRTPHLPQGAPTSPALANLCAYRLDMRFDALARSVGAGYTRYADDLAFSGDEELERALPRFQIRVAAIALEEGFSVNARKTRAMREGTRQLVTGIVVNRHANIPRYEYDQLKAILTNCARHGPASQNREAHADYQAFLAGKIAYARMINPLRGARLGELFDKIIWPG